MASFAAPPVPSGNPATSTLDALNAVADHFLATRNTVTAVDPAQAAVNPPADPVAPVVPATAAPVDPAVTPAAPAAPDAEMDLEASIAALAAEAAAPVPKVKEAWTAYQANQELAKPEAEGGIGHVPGPAQIRAYYNGALSFDAMVADLQAGNVDNFVSQMENLAPGVGETLAAKLGSLKPEAQAEIERRGQQAFISRLWEDIQSSNDPASKSFWEKAVRGLYTYMTGEKEMPATGPKFAQPEEPAEVKKIREERDALLAKGRTEAVAAWESAYQHGRDTAIHASIEEILKPWRGEDGRPKVQPLVYQGLQRSLFDAAVQGLKGNPYVSQQLNVLIGQAKGLVGRDPAQGKVLLDRAMTLIRTSVGPVLQKARADLAAKPAAVTQTPVPPRVPVAAAAGSPGVTPGAQNPVSIPARTAGQSQREWLESALAAASTR